MVMYGAGVVVSVLFGVLVDMYTDWIIDGEYTVSVRRRRTTRIVMALSGVGMAYLALNCALLRAPIEYSFSFLGSFVTYLLFFAGLASSVRTDLEAFVVFRPVELTMLGVGFFGHLVGAFAHSPVEALSCIVGGYVVLWLFSYIASRVMRQEAVGIGDAEFIAIIGAFFGFHGMINTILVATFTGAVYALLYSLIRGYRRDVAIPFVPFLAIGVASHCLVGSAATTTISMLFC